MHERLASAPETIDGVSGWKFRRGGATALFLGRGTPADREAELPEVWIGRGVARARLRQVHGSDVRDGRAGVCGEGDALVTGEKGLALEIATADCVPVLLDDGERLAAAHAGWRGIAAGVVGAAVARLAAPRSAVAWIGPAIGPCCYEVDEETAARVAASSPGAAVVARRSERGRPVLDLVAAVAAQLAAAGVARVTAVERCTRCHPDELWSYRGDGPGAGRNLALIYRAAR